jgi:hypothetical protein
MPFWALCAWSQIGQCLDMVLACRPASAVCGLKLHTIDRCAMVTLHGSTACVLLGNMSGVAKILGVLKCCMLLTCRADCAGPCC